MRIPTGIFTFDAHSGREAQLQCPDDAQEERNCELEILGLDEVNFSMSFL